MENQSCDEGLDECRSMESYIVLDSAQQISAEVDSPPASIAGVESLRDGGTVTQRLRDSKSTAELTAVLNEMWKPDAQVVQDKAERISSRQGIILGVEVEDVLFDIEADLKKLLSLIVYKKAGFETKTAAIDALTWLSSLDVVLENPAVSKEDICKWVIQLCVNEDLATASTGLRGVRNLANVEWYHETISAQEKFVKILDYLETEAQIPRFAQVYIFEIYFTLLNARGTAPGEDVFLQKLIKCVVDEDLSVEARRWGLQCMETCIRLSDDRETLIQTLLDRGDITAWLLFSEDTVITDTLELVNALLVQLPETKMKTLLTQISITPRVMDNLFSCLKHGTSELETGVLKLLAGVSEHAPRGMYTYYLDDNWIRLQSILEEGTEENKSLTLDLLHHIAKTVGSGQKNFQLPLPESGRPFVELLTKQFTCQTFDILHFMWTHYQDVLPLLLGIQLPSAMLCWLMESGWRLERADIFKIREFLGALLMETTDLSPGLREVLIAFLRSNLITENEAYVRQCLPLSLELIANLEGGELLTQLMEEDLVSAILELIKNQECLRAIEDPADLFCILKAVMQLLINSADCVQHADEICALFMYTINSAEAFGIAKVVQVMNEIKSSNPSMPCVSASSDLPGKLTQTGLNHRGLAVLETLLHQWAQFSEVNDLTEFYFLDSLLRLLLVCLDTSEEEIVEVTTMLKSVVCILGRIPSEEMPQSTRQCFLSILAVERARFRSELIDQLLIGHQEALENLWNMTIQSYGSHILSVSDGQSVLCLLKSVMHARDSGEADEQLARIVQKNSELMSEIAAKTKMISELEENQQDLGKVVQELSEELHNSSAGSSSKVDQDIAPTVVKLETQVKRLVRQIGEKESRIVALTDQNEQLTKENHNRKQEENNLIFVIDSQYQRIVELEGILKAEGYDLDD